ncbi:MAG: hypothetical protein AB3N28_11185, partial [Kordiimonas sp.]
MKHKNLLKTVLLTSTIMLGSFSSFAEEATEEITKPTTLQLDHLICMKTPTDVQISPEGDWVAYVVRRNDEEEDRGFSQIWMTSTDGKQTIPLTASYANASSPRWSPDGKSIAFTGTRGDDEDASSQVWLLNRLGGEAQQYTDVEQGVDGFAWSPDGTQMLLSITDPEPKIKDEDGNEVEDDKPKPWVIDRLQFKHDYVGYLDRKRTHLYLFDGKNDPVQITSGDYDDESPHWSPDSKHIAFVSKRDGDPDSNNNSDIWVVAADASAKEHPLTQVTTNKGSDHSPTWSPDSKTLAYITTLEPEKLWYDTERLAVKPASGEGAANILT